MQEFDKKLEEARAKLKSLQAAQQAGKPWVWRLANAERRAHKAQKTVESCENELEQLQKQKEELVQKISEKKDEIKNAKAAMDDAVASAKVLRLEGAALDEKKGQGHVVQGTARDVVNGILEQLQSLPRAFAASNGSVALEALVAQTKSLLEAPPTAEHRQGPPRSAQINPLDDSEGEAMEEEDMVAS